jgi:hypothetical protein
MALKGHKTSGEVLRGDAQQVDATKVRLVRDFGLAHPRTAEADTGWPGRMLCRGTKPESG